MLVNKMEEERNDIAQETKRQSIVIHNNTFSHETQFFQVLLRSSSSDSEMMGVILVQYMY